MSTGLTLGLLAGSLVFTAFSLWRGLQATKIGRVRLIPWVPLGLFGAVLSLMLLTHLVNMAGIETGGRFR